MFAGQATLNITSKPRNFDGITSLVASDSVLSEQAEMLLGHLLRLLSILHHVLEEQIPSLPSSKPSLPSLPNSTLSPIKKKSSEPSTPVSPPATEKTFSFKEEKKPRGYFYGTPFYMKQYEFVSSLDSTASASISARISYSRRSIPRNTDRSSLASYIRMFEPIVIKALKLYTVTSNIQLQVEVLQLLVTLVRLRVNYCLLDSDQIFIGFVTKQLESLQEAEITDCEKLIPYIFEFLVLLSYERYHSKTVIDIPRILQLCEGLAAGRERPERHVVPALEVVAVDLFERERSGDGSELETQREVAVNMLMKQMACPRIWDTLSRVLGILESEEDGAVEDKARKLSRQVVDFLVPLLCSHGVRLENRGDLDCLKNVLRLLSSRALGPCDKIMSSLLSCNVDLASMTEVTSWLGFTIVTFLTVFHLSPEEAGQTLGE